MRILRRTRKELWYANPTGRGYHTDANGLKTGEPKITYGTPVKEKMSIAVYPNGASIGSSYGIDLGETGLSEDTIYRAITDDVTCAMGKGSIVWYGREPTETVNNVVVPVKHNLKVERVIPSPNSIVYFLKEVDLS